MSTTTKTTTTANGEKYDGFTDEERGAMKERAMELKTGGRRGAKPDPEHDVFAKIAEMPDSDRGIAERLHALIKTSAPGLTSKLARPLSMPCGSRTYLRAAPSSNSW